MSKSHIDFDDDVRDAVQRYANSFCRKNFTSAVNILCRSGAKYELQLELDGPYKPAIPHHEGEEK